MLQAAGVDICDVSAGQTIAAGAAGLRAHVPDAVLRPHPQRDRHGDHGGRQHLRARPRQLDPDGRPRRPRLPGAAAPRPTPTGRCTRRPRSATAPRSGPTPTSPAATSSGGWPSGPSRCWARCEHGVGQARLRHRRRQRHRRRDRAGAGRGGRARDHRRPPAASRWPRWPAGTPDLRTAARRRHRRGRGRARCSPPPPRRGARRRSWSPTPAPPSAAPFRRTSAEDFRAHARGQPDRRLHHLAGGRSGRCSTAAGAG